MRCSPPRCSSRYAWCRHAGPGSAPGEGWFVRPVAGFAIAGLAGRALAAGGHRAVHGADAALGRHPPARRHPRRPRARRLRFLLGIALPDYWGTPTQTPLEFFLLARAFYAGALPLMLPAWP